ncbi:hypothetical protein [Pontibacter pamirensis]|uniref:hypothetical protein n=1 Tax=Pontibacter pamirensis TaxID=2562824 RepID=UPI001389949E|nr:hypothetical protein [Pontibacter pamirensis]
MHTTVFKFEEGSPYINSRRPIGLEIHNRLLWQAMRLAKTGKRIFKQGLVVYTPIPAYLSSPTTLEIYWDFKSSEEYDNQVS